MNNQRNLILAVVLSLALILGWDLVMTRFFPQPEEAPAQTTAGAQGTADAPMIEPELVLTLALLANTP